MNAKRKGDSPQPQVLKRKGDSPQQVLSDLKVKLFADGADKAQILKSQANGIVEIIL